MVEKVPMTASGYAALGDELKQRQSVERPRIIEHIAEARSHGDLSENAEYHAAKEKSSRTTKAASPSWKTNSRAPTSSISQSSPATPSSSAPP